MTVAVRPTATSLLLLAVMSASASSGCRRESLSTLKDAHEVRVADMRTLHRPCQSNADCPLPQTCFGWVDEASRSRTTCEIRCEGNDQVCPEPLICVIAVDGPSMTCQSRIGPK